MKKLILITLSLLLLMGCSQRLSHINPNITTHSRQVSEKSYVLNQVQSGYVGENIIRVSDYVQTTSSTDIMKPTKDFIYGVNSSFFGNGIGFNQNDEFKIAGGFKLDGGIYTAVSNPKLGNIVLLIDGNGVIQDKAANMIPVGLIGGGEFVTIAYTFNFSPMDVKLETTTKITNSKSKNGENYELVYTGRTPDSFMLVYREYTLDDLARPAFFQNLTYSVKQKQIRFKKLLIEIVSVDNEKIVYKVLED